MPSLKNPQYRAFVKRHIRKRDDGKCHYCGRQFAKNGPTTMTIEHLKAKMKGGTDALNNLAAACLHCNHHRGKQMNETKQRKEKVKAARVTLAIAPTFTDQEVEEYLHARRGSDEGFQSLDCLHCGNSYPAHEGGGGLCEICFDRD